MINIDGNLLVELGLGELPDDARKPLLTHIYETLELRVGEVLADQMTDEQIDEFGGFFDRNDDAGAFGWLQANFPNYKDVVKAEFEKLKVEIAANAEAILAAS
jgi:hypothetical protein